MKPTRFLNLFVLMAALMAAACGGTSKKQRAQADQLMENIRSSQDYDRLLSVADSLEAAGGLSPARAAYWRGYAYDRQRQADKAESYWKTAMDIAGKATDADAVEVYVKSASRLANLLSVRGDYEATLRMALPAAERLEALKCDTTSDYVNLLIYIGCCQASMGQAVEEADHGFYRAYKKHLEIIERYHSDASYKDAIAGLINVAYYCVQAGRYEDALYYTRFFGELLGEYEQRQGVSADYIDRQLGRYDIYKAQALVGLGRMGEAAEVFEAFQATGYSKSKEGRALAESYLSAAEIKKSAD